MKCKLLLSILVITLFISCTNSNSSKNEKENSSLLDSSKIGKTNFDNIIDVSKDSLISKLYKMKSHSLDSSADIYWKIIKRGKTSIPLLIKSLTDTTLTNVFDQCKGANLNVGEVSYFALEQIGDFPAFVVTHIQFDVVVGGCWNFYTYLFNNKNKAEFQRMVQKFYNENEFVYVKFDAVDLNESVRKYSVEGKYVIKKNHQIRVYINSKREGKISREDFLNSKGLSLEDTTRSIKSYKMIVETKAGKTIELTNKVNGELTREMIEIVSKEKNIKEISFSWILCTPSSTFSEYGQAFTIQLK